MKAVAFWASTHPCKEERRGVGRHERNEQMAGGKDQGMETAISQTRFTEASMVGYSRGRVEW